MTTSDEPVDFQALDRLLHQARLGTRHLCDFWWRMACHGAGDADVLTFSGNSGLEAVAAWQWPWACLDVVVAVDAPDEVEEEAFEWALRRFGELAA